MLDALEAENPQPEAQTPQYLNRDDRSSLNDKLEHVAPAASRR